MTRRLGARAGSLCAARLLRGSWREQPPEPEIEADELASVHERVIFGGAGGLAWWAVRDSPLADTPAGGTLRDVFRVQVLDAKLHEMRLVTALDLLGAAGVDPVVAKGWAVARLYPHAALRPYGDLDVFVAPEALAAARAALAAHEGESLRVDLHAGVTDLGVRWDVVDAHTTTVELDGRRLRVLGNALHLAMLASHMLRHGAWRPAWLCDVALLAERAADIDWVSLGALTRRRVREVRVSVLLAREVLGADVTGTPWHQGERTPVWLPGATLTAWMSEHYSTTTSVLFEERRASVLAKSLRRRWPNPIEVTARWRLPYNFLPRFPVQLLDYLVRGVRAGVTLVTRGLS